MYCRKKNGLQPTGQVKSFAIADGFNNVHDWLVYQQTSEAADVIAARKAAHLAATAPQIAQEIAGEDDGDSADDTVADERAANPTQQSAKSSQTQAAAGAAQAAGPSTSKQQPPADLPKPKRGGTFKRVRMSKMQTCVDIAHEAIEAGTPLAPAAGPASAGLVRNSDQIASSAPVASKWIVDSRSHAHCTQNTTDNIVLAKTWCAQDARHLDCGAQV